MNAASNSQRSFTTVAGEPSAPKAALQARVVDVLALNPGGRSTADVRDFLHHPDPDHPCASHTVVIERVYAALVALEHKGMVRRSTNPTGNRPIWELDSPPCTTDTRRSHPMPSTVSTPTRAHAAAALTARGIEDRLARIQTAAQAYALAEAILEKWGTGAWQRWKPMATAPLAGWLYTASRADATSRVDWILRALAHRAQWTCAARSVAHNQQLHDSLRSVSRLDDRQFTDVGWMLVLALFPWSPCMSTHTAPCASGAR